MMKSVIIAVLVLGLSLSVIGCSTTKATQVVSVINHHEVLLHAAVTIGVGKIIIDHPEFAQPLFDAARAARVLVTGMQEVRTREVVVFLKQQLQFAQMNQESQLLLRAAVEALVDEVQMLMAKVQPEDVRVLADKVLQWVQLAAQTTPSSSTR